MGFLGAPGQAKVTRWRGGVAGGSAVPPATWRTRGAHTEVPGAMNGAIGAAEAARVWASASSSSLASAQERVPLRSPLIIGSSSLKGDMVLNRASSPLEPSPKLSVGAVAREVMEDGSARVIGVGYYCVY